MKSRHEIIAFCAVLAVCVACFFHETLIGGKVLSPADVLLASTSFNGEAAGDYEPANRLLIDPVLQFQPWLEFNRRMIRSGRLPLWNGHAGCGVPHLANGQSAVFDPFHLIAYVGRLPAAYAWMAAGRLWVAGLGMFLLARSWRLGVWGRWFAGLVYPFCGFLILWLLYPVTAVAIWVPWLLLATDRLFETRRLQSAGWLAVTVAVVILGGHIQTSAHVLLAGGLYAVVQACAVLRLPSPLVGEGWVGGRQGPRLGDEQRRCLPNDSTPHLGPPPQGGRKMIAVSTGGGRWLGGTKPAVQQPPNPPVNSDFSPGQPRRPRAPGSLSAGQEPRHPQAPVVDPAPREADRTQARTEPRPHRIAKGRSGRPIWLWALGAGLGVLLAAVQIVPLGVYLGKSSVWGERQHERPGWWLIDRPRLLDAVCTAAPYAFGSQRRGHPNLARALGVHNINESAGGFAGLATLVWLAPLAVVTRGRSAHVRFLTALVVFGALGAFRLPPVDNLLRLVPVLEVTDNRRLTLWVAFGLTLLGGIGLDEVSQSHRLARTWLGLWVVGGCAFAAAAVAIPMLELEFQKRATAHYRLAATASPGADRAAFERRAERQVRQAVTYLPRYHGLVAGELFLLAALAAGTRWRGLSSAWLPPALFGLTLFDLALVGFGFNPAIDCKQHRVEPPVIARLHRELPPGARAIGVGDELPPNVLMRFGLADARNYDSVELARSLEWFAPLYAHDARPLSSRGTVTWETVERAQGLLRESGVSAIVAAEPPPPSLLAPIERVGPVWIARIDGQPWADSESSATRLEIKRGDGWARLDVDAPRPDRLVIRETWDPGWRASIDGSPSEIHAKNGVFISINVPKGKHQLILNYDPAEVRLGSAISLGSLVLVILVLTEIRLLWIPGIQKARGLEGVEPPS
jgi:hypothetical protein